MSALSELYRDDSDTDEDASSFADDDNDQEEAGEPSESTDAEETIEDTIEDEEATFERDEGEEEDSDRRGSDGDEEEGEGGSERSDKSDSERDEEASDQDRDKSNSSNRESDGESDGDEREKDDSESNNEEKREDSESGHDNEGSQSDSSSGKEASDKEDEDHADRGFEVYGYEDPDDFKDEPDPEKAVGAPRSGSGGMSSSQKICFFLCCLICMLLALVGGAVLGAILTDEDENLRSVFGLDSEDDGDTDGDLCPGGTFEPTRPPIPQGPPTAVFKCPEDNAALEFRIIFDANPGDVGLRVTDPFGINMWNFPTRSFGSFALLLRENIFTLCLSPQQNYTFELTDSGENGFISTFGAEIYGSFSLLYADELVTTYNGDCNVTNSRECGNFCKCTYLLAVNASSGACTTTCEAEI